MAAIGGTLAQAGGGELLGLLALGKLSGPGGLNDPKPLDADRGIASGPTVSLMRIWRRQRERQKPDSSARRPRASQVSNPTLTQMGGCLLAQCSGRRCRLWRRLTVRVICIRGASHLIRPPARVVSRTVRTSPMKPSPIPIDDQVEQPLAFGVA
jgi:hypothetical protein